MRYFIDIKCLSDLEKQEKWEEARKMLYRTWERDKQNSEKLIRLLSECWYVLSLWDCCISNEGLSYQVFQNTLVECIEFGLNYHNDNSRFLCIAGYMASVLPLVFCTDNTDSAYTEWEQRGIDMLRKSCEIDHDDPLSKVLYLGTTTLSITEYNNIKRQLLPEISSFFPSDTALEKYFKDILSVN